HAFSLTGDGVAKGARFMQDLDDLASVKSINPVAGLLIEAPGGNTLKLNKDFFIKRDKVNQLSLPMAAMALFTLQINAPSGGVGHRTGLRGGGPMTTLVRPSDANSSLWQKLWWNVINRSDWDYPDPDFSNGSVFPWLAPTRISDKTGEPIYYDQVHPLHVYWGMPRRMRLIIESVDDIAINTATEKVDGTDVADNESVNTATTDIEMRDDLTCEPCQQFVRHYRTQNYGPNYEGDWSPHPITPYRHNSKKPEETPFSIKAQPGGITYKIWHMLTFTASQDKTGFIRAKVLDHANEIQQRSRGRIKAKGLWAFSYDMDNMKARGFYSHQLPIYYISTKHQARLLKVVLELQMLTGTIVKTLRDSIKYSWMSERHAKDSKGDMSMIDTMFWQRSEAMFFNAIADAVNNEGLLTADAARKWLVNLCQLTLQIYDEQVLSADVVSQRHMAQLNNLRAFLYGNKQLTEFRNKHKANKDD
uniref:type I-E CRISPR-associated protein Cse1/CasA n=1 Tax=Psychrobacter sp. TaxID=56811 RepID=UPI0025DEE20B